MTPVFFIALLLAPASAWVVAPLAHGRLTHGRHSLGGADRFSVPKMQDEEEGYNKGISNVLGGGKSQADVLAEKNPVAEAGSLAAFVIVLCGLTFGALNPDAVEQYAKANKDVSCVEGKISNGKRLECNPDGSYKK
jgi:hypothetical protein